ncbi:MAG TPA: hypothetical protein HPP94_06045 [Desulfuromonadales bacterium]|nr:hypothetical protein [Desulfuromonadales bacterium]
MQNFFKPQTDWLKTWQEQQETLTKQYAVLSEEWMANVLGNKKKNPDFFEGWFKSQNDLEGQFKEFASRMNDMLSNAWGNKISPDLLKFVNVSFFESFYKNWLSAIELPGGIKNPLGMDGGWQQISGFLRSLMEKENPFFASFSNNKITEQMNQLFGLLQGTMGKDNGAFSELASGYQNFFGKLFETTSALGTEKLAESFEAWSKEMEKNILAPKLGINREMAHDIAQALVMSKDYMKSFSKMAQLVDATSRKANVRFQAKLSESALKNKPIDKFTDICALWATENEAVFLEVMGTQEFAQLQGDFIDAGHRVKIQWNKLAEKALEPTPIALKRDLDLAIAEITQMKRDMKTIQRELRDNKKEAQSVRDALVKAEDEAKKAKTAQKAAEAAAQDELKKAKIALKEAETAAKEEAKKAKASKAAADELAKQAKIDSKAVKAVTEDTTKTKSKNV